MSKVFRNKTILKILDYYKNLWALSYVTAVSHWDLETYMPASGAGARGEALAKISSIRQKMFLDKGFVELIHKGEGEKNLTDEEKGVIRVLVHSLRFYEKLPGQFLEDFEKLINTATVIWREAKEKNNHKLFEPSLTKIFEMNKKAADYLGYNESPYDALLDQFEEGLTASEVEYFFDDIKEPLKKLLKNIKESKVYQKQLNEKTLENTTYDKKKMEELNRKVLEVFWGDFGRFRLDVSAHPFTLSLSNMDTRITTWYHQKDFGRSLLATIHEFGHALYDLQSAQELEMTPIGAGSSLVIHESQSRFWENFIGRSEPFIKKFLPQMEATVGRKLNVKDVSAYFNRVSPGYLRVEADEVTYHFHIMLRYEIEKAVIEGKMKVRDIPEVWKDLMSGYLEMSPQNESEGALQDIHWSGGMVGYFPTYSLGTFLGAQWEKEISSQQIKPANYEGIKTWLKGHIHKYGSTYTLQDLLKKNGMKFDPSVNINYLQKKYSQIYGF